MLQGKCLCEGVRIEIDAPLGPVIACHCSLCRRSTGSAFNPNASVPAERFRITSGQELVHEFSRVPGTYRAFCSRCGSPLYGRSDAYPTIMRVRLGILDNTEGARPIAISSNYSHIACGYRPHSRFADGILLCDDCIAKFQLPAFDSDQPLR